MGSAAGDLLSCLDDESLCTSVQKVQAASGSLETPHPYENDATYMFQVSVPDDQSSELQNYIVINLIESFTKFDTNIIVQFREIH